MMKLMAITNLKDIHDFCSQYRNQTISNSKIVCDATEGERLHIGLALNAPLTELKLPAGTFIIGEYWDDQSRMQARHEFLHPKNGNIEPGDLTQFSGELLGAYGAADARDFITRAKAIGFVKYWSHNDGGFRAKYLKAYSKMPDYIDGLGGHLGFKLNNGTLVMEVWESQEAHDNAMANIMKPALNDISQSTTITARVVSLSIADDQVRYLADL